MTMRALLRQESSNILHDAEGDDVASRQKYRINAFDSFLARALRLLRQEGFNSETLAALLEAHIDELRER